MSAPTRPALRYMGGKWRLAPKLLQYFPKHRVYVEPYGGGASLLIRKPRAYAEVYNDLDNEVVGLFRILRDPAQALELARLVNFTPFARTEFDGTYEVTGEPIEDARRLVARSFMGHGSTAVALRRKTGFRADSNRSGSPPSQDWANLPPAILQISERFRGVVIENRPALAIMARFDAPDALIYADPPYLHDTRSQKRIGGSLEHAYKHEMSEADHLELLAFLNTCAGMVLLSGYPHPLYDQALPGWRRIDMDALADGARKRTEALWMNPAAEAALVACGSCLPPACLFDGAAA